MDGRRRLAASVSILGTLAVLCIGCSGAKNSTAGPDSSEDAAEQETQDATFDASNDGGLESKDVSAEAPHAADVETTAMNDGTTAPDGTDGATEPDGTDGATALDGTDDATALDGTDDATEPDGTDGATEPDGTDGATALDGTCDATALDGTDEAMALDGNEGGIDVEGGGGVGCESPTECVLLGLVGQACLDCVEAACPDPNEWCEHLDGQTADAGPAIGESRASLCLYTLTCILTSQCYAASTAYDACYCGTPDCTDAGPAPNAQCDEAEQAGLETFDTHMTMAQFTDTALGAGTANDLASCLTMAFCPACP
ncbi:MAG: hypothetical protein ABSF69_03915 [Polyangiaceae bacterium]|jgi:hypothetical protein